MGVGGQRHSPTALPPGKTRYPLYRRLGGPQGRFGRVWKISPPPGFDPPTVQPVASRYTDRAIQAHIVFIICFFYSYSTKHLLETTATEHEFPYFTSSRDATSASTKNLPLIFRLQVHFRVA